MPKLPTKTFAEQFADRLMTARLYGMEELVARLIPEALIVQRDNNVERIVAETRVSQVDLQSKGMHALKNHIQGQLAEEIAWKIVRDGLATVVEYADPIGDNIVYRLELRVLRDP